MEEMMQWMGKRSRRKRERRQEASRREYAAMRPDQSWPAHAEAFAWTDHEGLHSLISGEAPSPDQLEEMSRVYREHVRQSALWNQMVAQLGTEEAQRMPSKFRIELR